MVHGEKLRLALVGLGKQGLEHLDAVGLCQQTVIVAGVDPDAATRQRVSEMGYELELCSSLSRLAGLRLDGLVLALPHHCYGDLWDELIGLGLPMLKEKPLGRSFDEALSFIAVGEQEIDDRAWLVGRSEQGWIMLDSWRSGQPDPRTGKLQKLERVVLQTNKGVFEANREGVWHNGEQLASSQRDWRQAMADQLDGFVRHIRSGQWHDELIWDQLPAMRVIDEAYRLAARY